MKEFLVAISLSALQTSAGGPVDPAAIKQFHGEVEKYMAIRQGLLTEVSGPVAESTAVELNNASDILAAAIKRRRPGNKPGTLFTPPAAEAIKRIIADAVRTAGLAAELQRIDDEGGNGKPSVYQRFPEAAQMATMPPSLLAVLPELPKELEYRIVGTFLVLRDVDAALVLDLIPNAVPRK